MSAERWLPVVGWEGMYSVSDLGRVRSEERWVPHARARSGRVWYTQRIMRTQPGPTGNMGRWVQLRDGPCKSARMVARLVLEAFVCACPDGYEAAHLMGASEALVDLAWRKVADHPTSCRMPGRAEIDAWRSAAKSGARGTVAAIARTTGWGRHVVADAIAWRTRKGDR